VVKQDGSVLQGVRQVVVQGQTICALVGEGAVFCFGNGQYGSLGDGNAAAHSVSRAVPVQGLPDPSTEAQIISFGSSLSWAPSPLTVRTEAGEVYGWGYNETFALGVARDRTNKATAVKPNMVSCEGGDPAVVVNEWVSLPGGTYTMGYDRTEQEQKVITLPPFEMQAHEVTVGEYKECYLARIADPTGPAKGCTERQDAPRASTRRVLPSKGRENC
jgi:hypothetical protein